MSDSLSLRATLFSPGDPWLAAYATGLRDNELILGRNYADGTADELEVDDEEVGVTWYDGDGSGVLRLVRQTATGSGSRAHSSPLRALWRYADQGAAPDADRSADGDLYLEDDGTNDRVLLHRAASAWRGLSIRAEYRTAATSGDKKKDSDRVFLRGSSWNGSAAKWRQFALRTVIDVAADTADQFTLRISKRNEGTSEVEMASIDQNATLSLFETAAQSANPITDSYVGGLKLSGGYAGGVAVTRHNYLDAPDIVLAGGSTLTDACLVRYDAAVGTHKALDAGSTKTTPGGVDGWEKRNVNGTIYYSPLYTSKTT